MNQSSTHGQKWHQLADAVLAGDRLSPDQGLAILTAEDAELLDLVAAAYKVRRHYFGNRVQLNLLLNARCGLCSEDCAYCSQSRVSQAQIHKYDLVSSEEILAGAAQAASRKAKTYCIVLSGKSPSQKDLEAVCSVVEEIKQRWQLKICVSCGLLSEKQATMLKQAGVDRVNHNLNTSRRFYPKICSTHSYEDRLATLHVVRKAGLEICSGGIVGMGEEPEDVVELALTLGQLQVEATPVNFLIPIAGTPLENVRVLTPVYCLKVLVLFRLANPRCELRIAAGRELHLGPLQPLGLFIASSIFVGDYLTTKGQPPEDDYRMIEALGFEPEVHALSGGPH